MNALQDGSWLWMGLFMPWGHAINNHHSHDEADQRAFLGQNVYTWALRQQQSKGQGFKILSERLLPVQTNTFQDYTKTWRGI